MQTNERKIVIDETTRTIEAMENLLDTMLNGVYNLDMVTALEGELMNKKELKIKEIDPKFHVYERERRLKNGNVTTQWVGVYANSQKCRKSNRDDVINFIYDYYCKEMKSEMTVQELFDYVMAYRLSIGKNASTIGRNRIEWIKYVQGTPFAKMKINAVNQRVLKRFFESIAYTMTYKRYQNIKGILNTIFQFAYQEGYVMMDYCTPLRLKEADMSFIPAQSHKNEYWTEQHREKILEALENMKQDGYTWALRFMFCFNCRMSEIRGLKWKDITLDINQIPVIYFIRQLSYQVDGNNQNRTFIELNHTKSKKEEGIRYQPISDRAFAILSEIEQMYPNHTKEDFIFLNKAGKSLYPNKFNAVLKKACEIAGVPYYSSHQMRKYAITQELRNGISMADSMRLSGHTNAEMTIHYHRNMPFSKETMHKLINIHN